MLPALLAALAAAAFVLALCYPALTRPALATQRSAVFEALLKGSEAGEALRPTRNIRRAQQYALEAISQGAGNSRAAMLQRQIAAAGLSWPVSGFLMVCLLTGLVIFAPLAAFGFPLAIAASAGIAAAWMLPRRLLAALAERRKRQFLDAFGAAVDMIVRGAKSGLSLMDCLAIVAGDAEEPVRSEFEAMLSQLRAGVPMPAAMDKLSAIMPAPEVRFFALIIAIQSQTGGNLTDALGNLATVLRDRRKLAMKVRIASAEARISAIIIAALPFAVIGATAVFAPAYISFLWTDETGKTVAMACALWLALGILVLRRMARIEV